MANVSPMLVQTTISPLQPSPPDTHDTNSVNDRDKENDRFIPIL